LSQAGSCAAVASVAAPRPTPNPRHDRDFVDACLIDLMQHYGHWRRLGRLYAPDAPSFERCCAVRDAVECGRRIGMVIEGDFGRGYRLVAFRHPERVYLVKPGRPSGVEEEHDPRQLTLAECGAVE